jgi:bacterioferritin
MKGDDEVLEALNDVLTAELTAINQYFIHGKMCENWGYQALAGKFRGESIEEMRHAERVIQRILFLDGIPNMQRLYPVRVGEDVREVHQADLAMEAEHVKRLNAGMRLALERGDNGTRDLLGSILADEEGAVDWTEAQLGIIDAVGLDQYLAEHIFARDEK